VTGQLLAGKKKGKERKRKITLQQNVANVARKNPSCVMANPKKEGNRGSQRNHNH
jgi:hypothetical protein